MFFVLYGDVLVTVCDIVSWNPCDIVLYCLFVLFYIVLILLNNLCIVTTHVYCTIVYRSLHGTDGYNVVVPLQRTGTQLVIKEENKKDTRVVLFV
jgi:hypothetical protein